MYNFYVKSVVSLVTINKFVILLLQLNWSRRDEGIQMHINKASYRQQESSYSTIYKVRKPYRFLFQSCIPPEAGLYEYGSRQLLIKKFYLF